MKNIFHYTLSVFVAMIGLFSGSLLAQVPANDTLCNAQFLLVTDTCISVTNGDNTGATAEIGEPVGSCYSGGTNSVWFKFVPPTSGWVSLSTDWVGVNGTNVDTEIALYSLPGGDCSNLADLVEIACDQDGGTAVGFGYTSIIPLSPAFGDTMYVSVSGWNGTEGTFCLDIIEITPPAAASNDTLCNAVALTLGTPVMGDNTNALFEIGEPVGWCSGTNNSVWYSFVAPPSGYVNITTDIAGGTNTGTDIVLYALPGGVCSDPSDLFQMACGDAFNTGTGNGALLDSIPVAAGATFYVSVVTGSGTFMIDVTEVTPSYQPANDLLCDAITITPGTVCTTPSGDNSNSGIQIGEPTASCFFGTSNSVWYSFVGPASGLVDISTDIDSSFVTNDDTEIALYELPGANCADVTDLVEIGCDQDGGVAVGFNSIISAQAVTPGTMYYVQVSGWAATEGSFCLTLEELFFPVSDSACDATDIPVDGSINTFFNIAATVEAGEQAIAPPLGDGGGNFAWFETVIENSTWHTFTAPASGAVFIDMCNNGVGTDFDTQVAVYEVGACNDFATYSFIGANDDLPDGSCGFASILTVSCLAPGSQYYILVDGWQGDVGNYGISITEVTTSPLAASATSSDPDCPGATTGSVNLTVGGGGLPYTFSWDTGDTTEDLSGVGSGTYTVVVTDGCDSTSTVAVTVNAAPGLFAFAGDDAEACGSADIVLGGSPAGIGGLAFESQRAYGVDLGGGGDFFQHKVGDVDDQNTISTGNGAYFAGDFAFGIFFALDNTNQELVTLDLTAGTATVLGSSVPTAGNTWTGLAFNEQDQTMYGLSTDGATSTLYTIDLGSGAATVAATVASPIAIWLAIDTAGVAYILDIGSDNISSVDLTSGATTLIGSAGFNASFAQDADFDPDNNTLYLAGYNADNSTAEFYEFDVATGSSSYLGDFNRVEVGAYGILGESTVPFTYGWTPPLALSNPFVANPTSTTPISTDYVLTVTDACGTSSRDTVSVTVNPSPAVAPSAYPVFDGTGNAFANAVGGTAPYTYLWGTGETTEMIEVADSGYYAFTVTDANGCTATDSVFVGLVPTSIDDLATAGINSLNAYPNPSNGSFTLKVDLVNAEAMTVEVFDMKGKKLFGEVSDRSVAYEKVINLGNITAGVYMLQVSTAQGRAARMLTVE